MDESVKAYWNEDYWSRQQSGAIRGICSVIIILHHMAQKTCAPWLPDEFRVSGLEPFLQIGYLMVGVYLFCSGYGLYLSLKENPDYLDGFIGRHLRPIILIFVITNVCYYLIGNEFSGYNWYIYAIFYLYAVFWISFRVFKKDTYSILALSGFIALYILICELFVAGTWCYNTSGTFLVGLVFARHRESITALIRKQYAAFIVAIVCLLAVSFRAGVRMNDSVSAMTEIKDYILTRIGAVALQFVSAALFSVLLFAVNQKVRIRSMVLEYVGSMGLELYLVHVIFIEAFGYCFGNTEENIFYIRNLFLYMVAVLAMSAVSAYLLSLIRKGSHFLYTKYSNTFGMIERDAGKALKFILIGFAVVTVILTVIGAVKAPALREKAEEYKKEHIIFTQPDNKGSAVSIAGSGEKAVMIMRGRYDPCPTLTLKALEDELAKDFRVIVADFPGTGFSNESSGRRSIDNICSELHDAAMALGLHDYMLLAEGISCLYAQYYVDKYQDEVSAVITLDAETAGIGREVLKEMRISVPQYRRQTKKAAALDFLRSRIDDILGYKEFTWPLYEDIYSKALGWENLDAAKYIFFSTRENKAIFDERCNETDAYLAAEKLSYPENIEVIDFISEDRIKEYGKRGIMITEQLDALSCNCRSHRTITLVDCTYCALFNPSVIRANLISPR